MIPMLKDYVSDNLRATIGGIWAKFARFPV